MTSLRELAKAATRPIASCPGYAADECGNIWSVASNWRGYGARPMRPSRDSDGYFRIRVLIDGRRTNKPVHRLVCEAFHGEPPQGAVVRHLDGTKNNNAPSNLRWGTVAENAQDSVRHGVSKAAENGRASAETLRRRWDHLKVMHVCPSCGETFETRRGILGTALKRGRAHTCSLHCGRTFRHSGKHHAQGAGA